MMTKGIFLVAHTKRGYAFAAYNLALSIKRFNPELHITLLHDDCINQLTDTRFFDTLIPFKGGDAGEVKANIYEYLPYDYNLYLDVDSIALSDVSPILDELIIKGGFYYTHVSGSYTDGDSFPEFLWATPIQLKSKYKFSQFHSVNSTIQFIKKCDESKELFDKIKEKFSDPIPLNELKTRWGGTQPDELYIGAALAELNIDPTCKEYVYFASKHGEINTIWKDFKLLTLYGGKGFSKIDFIEWYDRLMHVYAREFLMSHNFKAQFIMADKHVNNK